MLDNKISHSHSPAVPPDFFSTDATALKMVLPTPIIRSLADILPNVKDVVRSGDILHIFPAILYTTGKGGTAYEHHTENVFRAIPIR